MGLLPARPLRLSPWFVASRTILCAALAVAGPVIVILLVMGARETAAVIRREDWIWAHGIPVPDGSVEVEEVGSGDYHLRISYRDQEGRWYEVHREVSPFFGDVNTDDTPTAKYDPQHHDRVAVSWVIDLGWERWVDGSVFGGLMLLALGVASVFAARIVARNLSRIRAAAARSEEIALEVVRVFECLKKGEPSGITLYTYRLPPDQGGRECVLRLTEARRPLFTDPTRARIVALRAPSGEPVPVREDLYPFRLTPEQQEELRLAVARGSTDVVRVLPGPGP